MISNFYSGCFDLAYCNLRIYHYQERRRESDREPIEPISAYTPQEAERFFRKSQENWESSETCQQLRSTILSPRGISSKIDSIVAFACSTMSLGRHDESLEESILIQRAVYQHALILTLQHILLEADSQHNSVPLTCYAQDPIYTAGDKTILKNHSITVLDDPRGFLEVDESTMVLSIAANVPVKVVIADITRPAVLIWNRLPREGEAGFGRIT